MGSERWKGFGSLEEAVVTVLGDHYGLYGRLLDPQVSLYDLGADDVDYLEVMMTLDELLEGRLFPLPPDPPTRVDEIIAYCRKAATQARS